MSKPVVIEKKKIKALVKTLCSEANLAFYIAQSIEEEGEPKLFTTMIGLRAQGTTLNRVAKRLKDVLKEGK